jgi:hypothetical protein
MDALGGGRPDRVPRFEIWIGEWFARRIGCDVAAAHARLGQDGVMLPDRRPAGSCAWASGVDEWGRIWRNGIYAGGAVDTEGDLDRYSPPPEYAGQLFDPRAAAAARKAFPNHCLFYGTHIGPFMAGYMAMGFERFFVRLMENREFVRRLLARRTEWCIAHFRQAVALGAELIVVGDDAGHHHGPMISPELWREMILPCHRQIVESLGAPVIWHSDGNIAPLLGMAAEAGFVGVHGLEPAAGMSLTRIKRQHGGRLVVVGNIDVRLLCGEDLEAVRCDVRRCLRHGAGGYMLATCNSIFEGMNATAVEEMFRYTRELET